MSTCSIKGCDKGARTRGLCTPHYTRMLKGADMSAPIRVVFRSGSDIDRLKSKVKVSESTGCWEWQASSTPLGYGQMRFQGTRWLSHRVSWVLFNGDIPEDNCRYRTFCVLHRCDNPCCVNPEHLFLGDQKVNSIDSVDKGRWGKRGLVGEKHGKALVTEDQVREIRVSCNTYQQISERYGISKSAVSHIKKRRSWAHVE